MNVALLFVFLQVLSQSTINDFVDIAVQIAGAHIQKHANRQFVKNDRMNENQET